MNQLIDAISLKYVNITAYLAVNYQNLKLWLNNYIIMSAYNSHKSYEFCDNNMLY